MATIRLRGDRYQARVQRKGYASVARSFLTKEDAQKWCRGVERQMDLGEYIETDTQLSTLADVLDRYEKEVTPTKRGHQQERYRLAVIRRDKIAKLNIQQVTPAAVAAFRDRRLQQVSSTTAHHDLCTLSAVLEHARLEWSIMTTNPVHAVRKPTMQKGRERRLQDGEYARLLASVRQCRNHWLAPLFIFSVETACRRGEALALRWDDVDLNRRIATFKDTKNGDSRTIPLSTEAVQVLRDLPRSLDGLVFHISAYGVDGSFRSACKRAGVEGLRWHDLRHEAVSRLHELGLSTVEVAAISGHKTLACLARYSHMKAEALARKLA